MAVAFSKLVSQYPVLEDYGRRRGAQLLHIFERTQPRWVDVELIRAEVY